MAEKIKKFFSRKKADAKFKLAGPGRKLNDESSSSKPASNPNAYKPLPRKDLSQESRLAAQAALMRLNEKKRDNPTFNTSISAIKAQVKKELEIERKNEAENVPVDAPQPNREVSLEASPHLAVTGVYFKCFYDNEILPKDEWKKKIRKILYEQLESGEIADYLIACCIIKSCNKGGEKIESCVEILCKYLDNIISNPTEEKYRKIRMTNRIFCEKVQGVDGALELLRGAGFKEQTIPNADNTSEEKYLVFDKDITDSMDTLTLIVDALQTTEPITLELDRNLQVLSPSQAASRMDLPPDFYAISPEEIKREHQLRTEAMEKSLMLRTKAMREKDELREFRKYRYAVLRIRFPDGILLQGTFSVYEKLAEVYSFVSENLEHEGLPFVLISPGGNKLSLDDDSDRTLIDLRLVPATMLIFAWDPSVAEEIDKSEQRDVYLKPEVMILMPQA
ncbi:GDI interacting protein 3 [Arctopsyche grandis]|uniref:GDI interacting protein 3 n=1 Tax=Arctopsyche grandis TaxID=121162 RepID=UPI00406D7958